MKLTEHTYVPALRWRQGEYQALWKLATAVKEKVVPLVTIPPVEFDFELHQPKKSVHEHVFPFVVRYQKKWGTYPAWIALDPEISAGCMNSGQHVLDYIFDGLRPSGALAIPALPLTADSASLNAASRATALDGRGGAVLLRLEDLMTGNPRKAVVNFAAALGINLDELDVIIDLRAPNFEPYAAFANALIAALKRLGNLNEVRNLVLIGTAIPSSFSQIAKGTDEFPRHDWLFFRTLVGMLPSGMRHLNYGDHTVVHPEFTAQDMRMVRPSGKIIYTAPTIYATRKGGVFRGNEAQMLGHCSAITKEPRFVFRGGSFSLGDDYIADCANAKVGTGNQTTWKWVAINHHITTVVDDLAKMHATPSPP